MDARTSDVAATARSLRDAATMHKKAVRFHRKAARDCMQELRDVCEAHGIKLSIIKGGGENHGPENADGIIDGRA